MSRFFRQAGDSDSESSDSEELMSSGDEETTKPSTTAKPAMSRFLRTAGSDSSGSDSEEESSESESEGDDRQGEDESSDEEDRAPIRILSAVDKRLKEMEATGKVMENALKINDWMAISNGISCSVYVSYI